MIQKKIKYTDFNGQEQEMTALFNLTKAELTIWGASERGGLGEVLQQIVNENDTPKIMERFTEILEKSYGKKSPDGQRFMKSPEIFKEFQETEAYSELFMELCSSTESMSAFVNGLMPQELLAEVQKEMSEAERIAQGKKVPFAVAPTTE